MHDSKPDPPSQRSWTVWQFGGGIRGGADWQSGPEFDQPLPCQPLGGRPSPTGRLNTHSPGGNCPHTRLDMGESE